VARQLRLRNLGGIIIIDFIDMVDEEHKRQVLRTLEKSLARDHAKTTVYDFSPLGLVEMTRKRTTESLERQLCEPCHECSGRGTVKTAETVTYEIFREITRAVRQFDAAAAGDRLAEGGGAHHRRGIHRGGRAGGIPRQDDPLPGRRRSTCRSSSMSCCSDELQAHRIVGIRADAALQDVVVRGAASADGQPPPTQGLGKVALDARWSGTVRQWQAKATRLRLGSGDAEQVMDGLVVRGGQRYGLQARRIDAAPLLQLLALGDVLPLGMRGWLQASSAGAVLEDVDVEGVRGGVVSATARIRGLHFAPVGNAPGMRGVDGWLQGDADGVRLRFDPQAVFAFDWPAGFGVVHQFTADGEAVAWRDGNGWSVRTAGLALVNPDLQVKVRGGMGFANDGTRPRLDLAADLGTAQVSLAHGFWVHHLMPKSTVDWLDAALKGGSLHDIHAVVAGDLDDWPFRTEGGRQGAGVFRVDARMQGGVLKFQPDWPAAEDLDADIRFEADGFTVAGRSRIAGVPVAALKAGIARFGRAELTVDAAAAGDAKDFLAMLRASPLQKSYGASMDSLRVAGPAQAQFHMLLPFHHDKPPPHDVHGDVVLSGASLRDERWKLAFEQVRGNIRYDNAGFAAEGMQVRHEGTPGVLALRAGPHVRDRAHAFEGELDAQIDIDGLLDKAGSLAWLKPHVSGSSAWTVTLGIPRNAAQGAMAGRLQLRSGLVGTALDLPEPLRKPRGQPLVASVDLRLPLEEGEVEVALGDLLSLRSRSRGSATGVAVQLGGARADAPPADGLVVGGRAARVDALDWIGVIAGDRGGDGLPLRRIDVNAAQLRLLGTQFADARVQVVPAPRGTAVVVQGASLAGSLLVPIAGRAPPSPVASTACTGQCLRGAVACWRACSRRPPTCRPRRLRPQGRRSPHSIRASSRRCSSMSVTCASARPCWGRRAFAARRWPGACAWTSSPPAAASSG
jgi:uncharacterized protein (TIGR02099 family)